MPSTCKISVSSNHSYATKPMNVFYIWYAELCRRSNMSPLAAVKPPRPNNETILDFVADRIKADEWTPILNALRLDTSLHALAIRSRTTGYKFLQEVNTEERVRRMKRRTASLWTDYVLRSLMRSLSCSLKNTQVLSTLELDGLPLCGEYFELLLQTLRHNKTVKMLSFKHCPISDGGCQQLCVHIRFMPNVEVLNLSSCNLGPVSGQHIARVIKYQQINRYCESWHNSLRYKDPSEGVMAGLKRITLNNNPNMSDEGLAYILDELIDDLWIKAIDMQKCNITENMSQKLLDVVECSRSLEVADFRENDRLNYETIERILEILDKKRQLGGDPEYQWCLTSTTLYDFATCEPSTSNVTAIQKSRSAPLRQMETGSHTSTRPALRRMRTLTMIDTKLARNKNICSTNTKIDNAKKQLVELNVKLNEEISKRKETEKINFELQQRLKNIKELGNLHGVEQESEEQSKLLKVIHSVGKEEGNDAPAHKDALVKKNKTIHKKPTIKKVTADRPNVPKNTTKSEIATKNAFSPSVKKSKENTLKAQNIFEKFLGKSCNSEEENDEGDSQVDNVLNYYYDSDFVEEDVAISSFKQTLLSENKDNSSSMSNSNVSLERFLQEMNPLDDDLRLPNCMKHTTDELFSDTLISDSMKGQNKVNFRKLMVKVS